MTGVLTKELLVTRSTAGDPAATTTLAAGVGVSSVGIPKGFKDCAITKLFAKRKAGEITYISFNIIFIIVCNLRNKKVSRKTRR